MNNRYKLTTLLIALTLLVGVNSSWAQAVIAGWDFNGQSNIATFGATTFNVNLDASTNLNLITRGAGASASAGANSFRTTGFQNDGISTANTDYFQVTLKANTGYTLSLESIDARVTGTSTFSNNPGVSQQYAYSTNGTDFTLIGSPSISIGTNQTFSVDVSGVTALQDIPSTTTVYIRYYASGQTTTGGWGFFSPSPGNNGLAISGTLNVDEIEDPLLSATPTSLSGFEYAVDAGPSSAQSFEITGFNLDGSNVTVTAPSNFEVASTEEGTFGGTVTLTAYDGTETTVWARLAAGLAGGDYSGNVTISGGSADQIEVAVSGKVAVPLSIPYENTLRTQADVDAAVDDGFLLNGGTVWGGTAGGGYLRITNTGNLESPIIDFTDIDNMRISMGLTTFGGNTGQILSVELSNDGGENYTTVASFEVPSSYATFSTDVELTSTYNVENGRIRFRITAGTNQVRFRDLVLAELTTASTSLTGTAGYRLLSSPVATTIQEFLIDNDIFTQCFTGAHYESGDACDGNGGANVFFLNNGTWTAATNATQAIGAGTGVLVYVYDSEPGEPASWPKALSVSGVAHTLPVSPTVNQSVDGFSLIGNPSTSTISFDEITRTNLYDVVYVWDPNFTEGEAGSSGEDPRGTGAGSWVAYNGIGGDLTDGLIAPFQSFLIATEEDGASLSITTDAVSGSTTLRGKEQEKFATRFLLRGEGMANATWFTFSEHGELGTDRADAQKLMPYSSDYALLMSRNIDGTLLDINNLPVLFEEIVLPVYVNTTVGGSYQLELSEANIPTDMSIHLVERSTGNRMQVEAGFSYTFSAEENRFAAKSDGNDNGFGLTSAGDPLFDLIFQRGESTSAEVGSDLPQQLSLDQNYPNPFNPSTQIRFALPGSQNVKLAVYDLLGREIAVLLNENMSAGSHTVSFDASTLSSGVYVYRIESAGQVLTRKMTLVK